MLWKRDPLFTLLTEREMLELDIRGRNFGFHASRSLNFSYQKKKLVLWLQRALEYYVLILFMLFIVEVGFIGLRNVFFDYLNSYYRLTNLIDGTGNACAWHSKAKLRCSSLLMVKVLVSMENEGAFAPTGSARKGYYYRFFVNAWECWDPDNIKPKTHLIDGTGNAWAWHNNAKLWFIGLLTVQLSVSIEKEGLFAPTGSI